MSFFGREKELETLHSWFSTKGFEGIIVYGRRRIGKSQLLNEALKQDMPKNFKIYFEAFEAQEETNLDGLCNKLTEGTNIVFKCNNFVDLFKKIFEFSIDNPIVLVIDEYQKLRNSVKGIDSIISNCIDEYLKVSNLKIVLCGSEIDIMKSVFSANNSLFGRLNRILPVRQLDYLSCVNFYPHYSLKDKVRIYAVFGGVPYYNQFIDDSISVEENIKNLITSPNARLLPEIEDRLKVELGKMDNCNEVLMALAKGKSKFADILNESHVSSSPALADTLNKLKSLEIIHISSPINESSLSKKTLYTIGDPLCKFYYKYIYWNYSSFNIMEPNMFYDLFVDKQFEENDVPKTFEFIAKQYLIARNKKGLINPPLLKVGTYYFNNQNEHANGEIDIATFDQNGYKFYEVKFTDKPINNNVIKDKEINLNKCDLIYYKLGFISLNGFENDINKNKYELLTIEDLYEKTRP